LIRRFVKPGHVAEIKRREVKAFEAIEFIVFVDGSLLESQLFHGARMQDYDAALRERVEQFARSGWIEEPLPD